MLALFFFRLYVTHHSLLYLHLRIYKIIVSGFTDRNTRASTFIFPIMA